MSWVCQGGLRLDGSRLMRMLWACLSRLRIVLGARILLSRDRMRLRCAAALGTAAGNAHCLRSVASCK